MGPDPKREDISAWYELGMMGGTKLVLRIHDVAIRFVKELCNLEKSGMVEDHLKRFRLEPFQEFGKPGFGFGGIFVAAECQRPTWKKFRCELPIVYSADGSITNSRDRFSIRATLAVIFTALSLFDRDTKFGSPQLMVFERVKIEPGLQGAHLMVDFTPTVSRWLASKPKGTSLTDVENAMRVADARMWQDKRTRHRTDFIASCGGEKWLQMSVPGNACQLSSGDYNRHEPSGYGMATHNCDFDHQQFTFIVGLAALQDMIRREGLVA